MDEFPHVLRKRRVLVSAIACVIEFLLGLPLITQGGIYALQIIDWYCASFSLMLISFAECVAVAWIYGVDRFYKDLEMMIGYKPSQYWSFMWRFLTPITILFVWIFSVVTLGPVTYGTVTYPQWAIALGWSLGVVSLVPIPGCAIYQIYQEKEGTLIEKIKKLSRPAAKWGPKNPEHMEEYQMSLKGTQRLSLSSDSELRRRNQENEEEKFLP